MALAEARAAWQRTVNRCLVQEDAKRAPKFACCSSASPSVKLVEAGSSDVADVQDTPSIGCPSLNPNSSYSNLSPNSRWWLQNQPNYGYQNSLMNEQFNASEANMETCGAYSYSVNAHNEDDAGLVDQIRNVESAQDNQCRIFPTSEKKDFIVNDTENFQDPLKLEDAEDLSELTNIGGVGREVSKKSDEFCFDSESSWVRAKKNDPWWRTADTEELAVLVAHRSLDLIGNCDLPQPHDTHVKDVNVNLCCLGPDANDTSSLDLKPDPESFYNLTSHMSGSLSAEIPYKKHRLSAEGELLSSSDKRSRVSPTHKWMPEMHNSDNDPSKAQLLEALCHSQTRAREAEKSAKRACAEKEHIVQLVFRQASQLFAYKQWFQILQLENIYFQIKNNKSQPISTISPLKFSQVPRRTKKTRKSRHKSGSEKRSKQSSARYDISKYAVVFALGLGLVSAGLFLGWTVGCMLPRL